jgi:hypothetical protein
VPTHDFQELIAREHQLGDHRHQVLERVDVDADRLVDDFVDLFIVGRVAVAACARGAILRRDGARHLRLVFRPRRFAKCPLELVERDFSDSERALQFLIGQ